jgi:SSS family solute:Na+ symporter
MGISGEWPLIIAFIILAAYTYQSGLRAPALIAFVKDALIYIVVIVAVIYIPIKLGGFDKIFSAADAKFTKSPPPAPDGLLLADPQILGYSTLAFGSALALFLYPHSVTGLLATRSRDTIRRNMAALPAYSFVLGLLALLGLMAIAAGVTPLTGANGKPDANTVVPLLFDKMFPDWFAGIAFAAIGIGALVPAAIMSIAAANLFTRNIYKEYFHHDASPAQEARVSRLVSLVVKAGAVVVILVLDPQFSIDLQLIGGVIIVQTLPAVAIGLYTRALHAWGLLAGWAAGMAAGLYMLYDTSNAVTGKAHFGGPQYLLSKFGLTDGKTTLYTGIIALALNLIVAIVVSLVLRGRREQGFEDRTTPDDYEVEAGDPGVKDVDAAPEESPVTAGR